MSDIYSSFLSISNSFLNTVPKQEFLLIELGMIIILCAIMASFSRLIKQPPLFAYVLSGFIIGPALFGFVKDMDIISSFSSIGIAFLVFLAGLEISLKKLKQVNMKKIVFIGLLQIAILLSLALPVLRLIGMDFMQSVYLGMIITFSSTMVVLKLLSDSGDLVTLHGRILIAILLLQDLFAIFAISLIASGEMTIMGVAPTVIKLFILIGLSILLQKSVLNYTFKRAAASKHAKELVVLFALAVLFIFIILSLVLELSIAIGAFIAGMALANLSYKSELEARIKPLRDFFSILFFVALGMQITVTGLRSELALFGVLIIGAIVIKPLVTFILLKIFGYTEKTSFVSAIGLGQLSEFSIMLGAIGFTAGVLSQTILSTVIIATIVTMSLAVFMLEKENQIYAVFRKPISLLNFIPVRENVGYMDDKSDKTILIVGCDRMGKIVLREFLPSHQEEVVVIDYNPEIIAMLKEKKISCVYGDIESPDILESFDVKKLTRVISTAPNLIDGVLLLKKIKSENKDTKVILTAQTNEEALELYDQGADYVVLPRFTAGEVVSNIIKKDDSSLKEIKKNQIDRIKRMGRIFEERE
jgi:Kef-type K+ transport system membrane component KefB